MLLCQKNKKAAISFLGGVLMAILGFLIVVAVIEIFKGEAEASTTEAICRASVALREKSYREIAYGLDSIATPLACRTTPKNIPENKDAAKEDVEQEIAGLMASCWKQFGEGRIPDVFKKGDPVSKNCFICYDVNVRETSKFNGEISSTDLRQYLFDTPYKASGHSDDCKPNGGYCLDVEKSDDCMNKIAAGPSYMLIDKENDVCKGKNKKACCYTDYECWNRGGICSKKNPDTGNIVFAQYDTWDCPSSMHCYIKKENYFSYGDYIQRYGGQGNLLILADNIKPGETYAISFGSPTDKCSDCTVYGENLAIIGGVIGAASIFLTGGGSLVAYGGAIVIWSAGGYVLGKFTTEKIEDVWAALINGRKLNTIYFTTLNEMQRNNNCRLVKDLRES